MDSAVFTAEQENIIESNSVAVAKTIRFFRDGLPVDKSFDQYISSAASNEGTQLKLTAFHF